MNWIEYLQLYCLVGVLIGLGKYKHFVRPARDSNAAAHLLEYALIWPIKILSGDKNE